MGTRLQDTTALVTGATSGIGRAIALGLAAEGAHVAVAGRDRVRGEATVAAVRAAGGRAELVLAELDGSAAASQDLAGNARAALGGAVDVLVNNAGVVPGVMTLDHDEAMVDDVLAVNVRAPFFLTQALVPGVIDRGGGAIVNVGSWVARVGLGPGTLYSATKALLEQLTRGWAAEFGPSGVRVNSISPGMTVTEGTERFAEMLEPAGSRLPAGRLGTPQEIAHAAVFLADPRSSYVHGATIVVDGGASATRSM